MSRRAVFLDRDGVINVSPPKGQYINCPEDFHLLPNIVDWIRLLNALDILVIVVTNQRGVALGRTTPDNLDRIHEKMRAELSKRGAVVNDVFVCPHEEGTCDCRKPRPGLILTARKKWDIELAHSLLIGDSERDRGLAENCGLDFLEVADGRIQAACAFGGDTTDCDVSPANHAMMSVEHWSRRSPTSF